MDLEKQWIVENERPAGNDPFGKIERMQSTGDKLAKSWGAQYYYLMHMANLLDAALPLIRDEAEAEAIREAGKAVRCISWSRRVDAAEKMVEKFGIGEDT